MKTLIIELVALITLLLPFLWEMNDDRNGEMKSEKKRDVIIRGMIMIWTSLLGVLLINRFSIVDIWRPFFMSFALFFFLFDYSYSRFVMKVEDWYAHLGKTAEMDQNKLWIGLGEHGRFALKVAVLIIALIFYF